MSLGDTLRGRSEVRVHFGLLWASETVRKLQLPAASRQQAQAE